MKESIEAGDSNRWMFQYTTFFQRFVLIKFIRNFSHTRRKIIPSRISKRSNPETNKKCWNFSIPADSKLYVWICTCMYTYECLHTCRLTVFRILQSE